MHDFQPKHSKLKEADIKKLLEKYNISLSQFPKIKITDSALPEKCEVGDVIKIDRRENGAEYFRVVVG